MKSGMPAANRIDWGRIADLVARELFGDPTKTTTQELRFGTKGSLKVTIAGEHAGTWCDFERGKGDFRGDTIGLVQHGLALQGVNVDRAGARAWLVDRRLIEGDNTGNDRTWTPSPTRPTPSKPKPPATATTTTTSKTQHLVAPILAGTISAHGTVGHRYLTGRYVWPPGGIGLPLLPPAVRWISRLAAERVGLKLPDGATGALVFLWRRPGGEKSPCAVSLILIDSNAQRVLWPKGEKCRAYGQRSGAMFGVRGAASGGDTALHVVEGECDALAVALMTSGGVVAMGSAGAMQGEKGRLGVRSLIDENGYPIVVIHADGDEAGRTAAYPFGGYLQSHGIEYRIERYADDEDPASKQEKARRGWIGERATTRKYDAGMTREEADIAAWGDCLTHCVKRGNSDD